jgi:hypothetical protein
MPKGIPNARHANVARATQEARKVLLHTKSWTKTKEHTYMWIKAEFGVSRTTATDYLEDVYGRLLKDPEVNRLIV